MLRDIIVAFPSVSQNDRTWLHSITDEAGEAIRGQVWYPAHPYSSKTLRRMHFNGYRDNGLLLRLTSTNTPFHTTDV
jgi:hypothetical protein